jgi:preprotein translocase subunit SecF
MARVSFSHWGNQLYTGERSYDFVGRRRIWYGVAVVAIILSIGALFVRGLNLGIEFTGGSEFRVSDVASGSTEQTAIDTVQEVAGTVEVNATRIASGLTDSTAIRVQTVDLTQAQTDQVKAALADAYDVSEDNVSSGFVGASWGQQVSQRALLGLVVFLALVSLAITAYFRTWKMAVAAIIALLHDLVITVGVYAAIGFEVTPASVIGFLTILGYSLYDTVVVFDKVRENTAHVLESKNQTFSQAANLAVNQTLVRSVNTSIVALLPVASILFVGAFLIGAGTLRDLALSLFVGIAAGTYSSIFIATPLLVHLRENEDSVKAHARKVAQKHAETSAKAGAAVSASAGSTAARSGRPVSTTKAPTGSTAVATVDAAPAVTDGATDAESGDPTTEPASGDGPPGAGPKGGGAPPPKRPIPLRPPTGGQRPQPRRGRAR